jgi:hypothetical protein
MREWRPKCSANHNTSILFTTRILTANVRYRETPQASLGNTQGIVLKRTTE